MGKLGKIFGPVVAVLALAAAVLSFLIYMRQKELRNRASDLAEALATTVKTMNSGTQSPDASKVSFTKATDSSPKEGGTLGWEDYKKSLKAGGNEYAGTLKKADAVASALVGQRDAYVEKMREMANTLKYPAEGMPDETVLQAVGSYGPELDELTKHAKAVSERDEAIIKNINAIGALVDSSVDEQKLLNRPYDSDSKTAGSYNVDEEFKSLKEAVENMRERCDKLAEGYGRFQAKVKNYSWKTSGSTLRTTPEPSKIGRLLEQLDGDGDALNRLLADLENYKRENVSLKSERDELEENINKLKQELQEQTELKQELARRLENLGGGIASEDNREPLTSLDEVDENQIGHVMEVNPQKGFVILDLNDKQIVSGARLAVMSGNKFVGTVEVTKVTANNSVADYVGKASVDSVKKGHEVILAHKILQSQNESED